MISTYTDDMKTTGLAFKLKLIDIQCLKKFSFKSDSNVNQLEAILEDDTPSALSTRARAPRHSNVMENSFCFVCQTRRENKDTHYNDGRKGRCSLDSSKTKFI